ncbi:Ger(x)C family spore germination protein [Paenibacillus whitsoniae]|uniref:Ger(X)C family spore germination protein n=1 Tax=Paenibacillus whitsoniae TaxID=2496558 RepID=A0A430JD45_9BACL|nr:Ger(x)C family spore germination protein [Paenibacillus whitsoniae]RTE08934.1 Ger(x)C family spore germination protein [Paenibacillus whitsoniae]
MRKLLWIALIMFLLLLPGCWDRVEIDQRGFVTGVAVDQGAQRDDEQGQTAKTTKYFGTYQIIIPAGLKQTSGTSGTAGTTKGGTYFNLGASGNTMPAITAKIASETSRSPYFEHLQIIVISSELLRTPTSLADILDYFLRNNEIRRGVKILISEGPAKKVLSIDAKNEKYPINYVESTINNIKNNNNMVPATRIGDLHEQLIKDVSYTIQKVSSSGGGISLTGAAVFSPQNQFIGFLNNEETLGLNLLKGDVRGGDLETQVEGQLINFTFDNENSRFRAVIADNKVQKLIVSIKAEGSLNKSSHEFDLTDEKIVNLLEQEVEHRVEQVSLNTISVLQKKYKKDVVGLGEYLNQNHYRQWKTMEKDWNDGDHLFSTMDIEVHVQVAIRRIGDINRSE